MSLESSELLNFKTLSTFIEMGADVLSSLVELYIQQSSGEIKVINGLIQNGDYENARQAIHSLKGASLNTGAQKMGDVCLALEESIKKNDTISVVEMNKLLPTVLTQTRQAFDELLSGLG